MNRFAVYIIVELVIACMSVWNRRNIFLYGKGSVCVCELWLLSASDLLVKCIQGSPFSYLITTPGCSKIYFKKCDLVWRYVVCAI